MSTPIKLTVIILTHRADDRFEKSIASAQFAEEVLIIDNNSQANWQTLSQKYSFRVVPYPQKLIDWSAVRNESLQYATHDWVLFLDSDEYITPPSISELESIITANFFDGIIVQRSDIFHQQQLTHGEAGYQSLVRMGKKNHLQFNRPVHEEATIQGHLGTSTIHITHHSHLTIAEFLNSVIFYAHREATHRVEMNTKLFLPNLIIFPVGKFVFNYIFKLGFLDGWAGFVYAFMMSLHSFFVRVFQYELEQSKHE